MFSLQQLILSLYFCLCFFGGRCSVLPKTYIKREVWLEQETPVSSRGTSWGDLVEANHSSSSEGLLGFFLFWIFETRFHSLMQASLELETILLPQASKSWDDRCEPPLAAILYPEGKYGGGLSYLWVSLLPCSQHGFKNVATPSVPEALINIGVFPHFCMATTPRIAPVLRSLEMAVAIGSRQLICSFCIIDLHMWGFS